MTISCRSMVRVFGFVLALLLLPAAFGAQPRHTTLYVFGDSLSDTGNDFIATTAQQMTPAIPPSVSPYATYYQGRFSNGPVAVEYFWRLMSRKNSAAVTPFLVDQSLANKTAVNFAFGGSASGISNPTPGGFVVPGLLGQVGIFSAALQMQSPQPNALYLVWTGSNDYIQGITSSPDVVVGNVAQAIRSLYAMGARDFLVPNLADMGLSPLLKAQGLSTQFTALTKGHNALLDSTISSLAASLPGSKFVRVNVFALGKALASTGLVNVTTPEIERLLPGTGVSSCLFVNPATCQNVDLQARLPLYLFWDVLHPTTEVHAAIGAAMYGAVLVSGWLD